MAYRIEYSPECQDHFRSLTARERVIVLDAVDEQLIHQPTAETRHRKLMRPNPLAPWELRIGDLRVYHEVMETPMRSGTDPLLASRTATWSASGGREISL